jgi:hypothetical protein
MNCPWQFAEPKETSNGRCLVCCQACGAILKIPCENDPARITGCRLKAQLRHKVRGKPWLHNLGDHAGPDRDHEGALPEGQREAGTRIVVRLREAPRGPERSWQGHIRELLTKP